MKYLPEHSEGKGTGLVKVEVIKNEKFEPKTENATREIHDEIRSQPTIGMSRTRAYVDALLDRPAEEVIEEVQSQVTIMILLANETIIRFMEKLLDPNVTYAEKAELQKHIQVLRTQSGELAKSKQGLLSAIGYDPNEMQTNEKGEVIGLKGQTTKMSEQVFEDQFGAELNPFAKR